MTRILPILALSTVCLLTAGCHQIFRFEAGATPELAVEQLDANFVAAANTTCVQGGTLLDQRSVRITDGTPMARYRYNCNPVERPGVFGLFGWMDMLGM